MTQRGSARRWRGSEWFAAMAVVLGLVVAAAVGACEPITHAGDFETEAPDATMVTTTVCGTGQTLCQADGGATVCTDNANDPNNCGGCGVTCPSTYECSSGKCVCPAGKKVCSQLCTDTTSDPDNCNGCGNVCPSNGGACDKGVCVLECRESYTNCNQIDAGCVNLKSDPNNCNTCGAHCEGGLGCFNGYCAVCPFANQCILDGGLEGGTTICVDKLTDYSNCGVCGHSCSGAETCADGVCQCISPDYLCTTVTRSGAVTTCKKPDTTCAVLPVPGEN